MNHLATKIQSMHYKLINLYANPEPVHKNDPTKYYFPIPKMKNKKRKPNLKRFTTILLRHYHLQIMDTMDKLKEMNPDFKTDAAFKDNRPFYFLCKKLKNKTLVQDRGKDDLVKAITEKLKLHDISTLKNWEKKVNCVVDVFFLMCCWYIQYEIKNLTIPEKKEIFKNYEEAAKSEGTFDVKQYETILNPKWNIATLAQKLLIDGKSGSTSMTEWMNIEITETGEVEFEKKAKRKEITTDSAKNVSEILGMLSLKLIEMLKTNDPTKSERTQNITREKAINICEENLNELLKVSGSKSIYTGDKRPDGRFNKEWIKADLLGVLGDVVIPIDKGNNESEE